MLERVTEQYVSAPTPTISADRVHVLHRDFETRSPAHPEDYRHYTSTPLILALKCCAVPMP